MGEDYAFCERFRAAGGTIWLRPDIVLTHVGSHVFTGGNLLDILEPKQGRKIDRTD
jgi:GT2 family glycosyltransferase